MLLLNQCCAGCYDDCADGEICVTVTRTGCGPTEGATVTVSQGGVTIGTCVTDATGTCCVPIDAAGTYDVSAVSPSGSHLNNVSTSVTATCTTNTVTLTPAVQTGYYCTDAGCCKWPIPEDLDATDGQGSFSISRDIDAKWKATRTWTASVCDTSFTACGFVLAPKSGTAVVYYSLSCVENVWEVTAVWGYVAFYTVCDSGIKTTPGWAYDEYGGGACLFGFHKSVSQTASITIDACEPGSFALTADFDATVYDSEWDLTIDSPTGGTVVFSS